jgi:GNAT superfamily N-acetyltransferase
VLDDGTGAAVGYVVGCPDVFAFAEGYGRYVDEVLLQPPHPPLAASGDVGSRAGGYGSGGGGARPAVPAPGQLERLEPWLVTRIEGGRAERVVNEEGLAQLAHSPRFLLFEGGGEAKDGLVRGFRATMHIDLLEGWQGKGWGRKIIGEFVTSVKGACAAPVREAGEERWLDCGKGVHIGVGWENRKVVPFYERVGFRVYEDCYKEGETIWMVYEF